MNRLRSHYKYVVQYDLITKLSHINCITLPKIESVTLNFGIKESVISTKKILAPLLFVVLLALLVLLVLRTLVVLVVLVVLQVLSLLLVLLVPLVNVLISLVLRHH